MKKILIINGHPDPESFCAALAGQYEQGAQAAGFDVKRIDLHQLFFDPILRYGYRQPTPLEQDLQQAQQAISQAEHLVWVFPVWWGSLPALLKGFIDRIFLPGFAFKFHKDDPWWDKLLKGRSARMLCTLDTPVWFYYLAYGAPAHRSMKGTILKFCGISPVKVTNFAPVRAASPEQRKKWLDKAYQLGQQGQ